MRSDEEWRWGAARRVVLTPGAVEFPGTGVGAGHTALRPLSPTPRVVGDRIPETPEHTPLYLVFPLELAAEGRLATDYSALDDRGLDDRWLNDRWCDDRWSYNGRLHDHGRLLGPGLVGLLAVLLHLDGAAIGLRIGVGDRLLLNPRLRSSVILIDRVDAGGDGAADAADR